MDSGISIPRTVDFMRVASKADSCCARAGPTGAENTFPREKLRIS